MFLIATMVGIEDALIVRIAEDHAKSLQHSVAFTFFATNIGGGIAGVIFGKLLIPTFGVFDLALVLGLLDGCFVLLNIYYFRNELRRAIVPGALLVLVTGAIMAAYLSGGNITQRMLQPLYNDPIVHVWGDKVGNSGTSSGGKKDILKVLTCERDTCKLFIQGQIQFSTKDEYMYHEPLVHPAMSIVSKRVANRPLNVLIAGGGDGLAAREVLKYPNVENVTVIDLDAEMTGVVARSEPLVRFNGDPFSDPRVRIINQDAYVWMRDHADRYFDVVIVDLVDPEDEAVAKLYSLEFYRMVKSRALARGGVIVTQSTSPWYAPRAFWTVNLTMSKVFPTVVPFRWNVPSFGDWGWNIASDIPFDGDSITIDEAHTRWLTTDGWKAFLFFGKDEWAVLEGASRSGHRLHNAAPCGQPLLQGGIGLARLGRGERVGAASMPLLLLCFGTGVILIHSQALRTHVYVKHGRVTRSRALNVLGRIGQCNPLHLISVWCRNSQFWRRRIGWNGRAYRLPTSSMRTRRLGSSLALSVSCAPRRVPTRTSNSPTTKCWS